MRYDAPGSYLPPINLVEARAAHADVATISALEDEPVRDIIDRQIAAGMPAVTSGEVRRTSWDKDFYSGLGGVSIEHVSSGSIYQPIDTFTDVMRFDGRIAYNPGHQFFESFEFIRDYVAGRARCRQTLPSPTDLYFDILQMGEGNIASVYPSPDTLIEDIAEAYRRTAEHFYSLGCRDILFDDTVCAQMCDNTFLSRLIIAGIDVKQLSDDLMRLLNLSVDGLPSDLSMEIYMSGGTTVVPEWITVNNPDNPLKNILPNLHFNVFFLPFTPGDVEQLAVLDYLPKGASVVLGLISAHSPWPDDIDAVETSINTALRYLSPAQLAIGPQCGFKMTHFIMRGLVYDDQWRKLRTLSEIARGISI